MFGGVFLSTLTTLTPLPVKEVQVSLPVENSKLKTDEDHEVSFFVEQRN